MNKLVVVAGVVALGVVGALFVSQSPEAVEPTPARATMPGAPIVVVAIPDVLSEQAEIGKRAFDSQCASCHGPNAAGREGAAPPLIHKIYEPSHHADEAFQRAVANGVGAHHWPFGNMPPVAGLTRADVATIVTYVRELQRANGIN